MDLYNHFLASKAVGGFSSNNGLHRNVAVAAFPDNPRFGGP